MAGYETASGSCWLDLAFGEHAPGYIITELYILTIG